MGHDRAAVAADGALDNGQADTGTAAFPVSGHGGTIKGLENFLQFSYNFV